MNIKMNLTIDPNEVAAKIAVMSSNEQSEFLNTFAKEFRLYCQTDYACETQKWHVEKEMTQEAKEFFRDFCCEEV